MERTYIKSLTSKIDSMVRIQGFVAKVRDQKHVQFLITQDKTGLLQCVNEKSNASLTNIISTLTEGSCVTVEGKLISAPQANLGGIELQVSDIVVHSIAETIPITKESSLDKRMDYRWIDLRSERNRVIFEVQTSMERAMRDFWKLHSFVEIHSPKLMSTASESGSELFSLNYFEEKTAYLAQSPQFYKQMAMSAGFDRIFEIGPVYRANPSFTSRHDTEFTSVDMEMSWIDSHEDIMDIEEKWIHRIISCVRENHGDEIKKHFDRQLEIPKIPFPRLTLSEAREILAEEGHEISHKSDLNPEGERMISRFVQKKFNHQFVFIKDYPSSARPFYHMRSENDNLVTKSYDLLWSGLEITTGAQREHRVDILKKQALEKGYDLNPLEGYLSFFKYGCPPHGGFGLGLTRFLMVMLGIINVREVTFLYRGPHRLTP